MYPRAVRLLLLLSCFASCVIVQAQHKKPCNCLSSPAPPLRALKVASGEPIIETFCNSDVTKDPACVFRGFINWPAYVSCQ